MAHPLVTQLNFARSEFRRGLHGLSDADARQRIMPMNCISWNVGHLAWQEQRYWLERGQGRIILPELNEMFCYGCKARTPPLEEMWRVWQIVVDAAQPFLDALTTEDLARMLVVDGETMDFGVGSLALRMIYHYWYHNGENLAIRQSLGHTALPDFVGNIEAEAPFTPY